MLSDVESKTLAKHIVQELIVQAQNEEIVGQISDVWGRHIDRWIGRSFRRVFIGVLIALVTVLGVKMQVWNFFR